MTGRRGQQQRTAAQGRKSVIRSSGRRRPLCADSGRPPDRNQTAGGKSRPLWPRWRSVRRRQDAHGDTGSAGTLDPQFFFSISSVRRDAYRYRPRVI